jgi:4-hydroxy-3-methylbut-2-en-1-yl diphosphate reductase
MTRLLVCAPLRIEARAVRRGYGGPVVHTGMGPVRSARSAARLADLDAEAMAITGVCGALDPAMRPGDLVVATELRRHGATTIACPSAELLAAELRRTGLTVHTGPIVTVDRVAAGARRAALAKTGACAVDMESAILAKSLAKNPAAPFTAAAQNSPTALAVVRAVVDTPDRPLLRPSTLTGGIAALAALRRIGPALETWAAATGPRQVILASPRAFCAGVERAIEIVERALDLYGPPVYVRKQIVHNRHVVGDLERRGAIFVDELDEAPSGARMVFSAHGVAPAVRAEAARRNLEVIDATCPLVAKVHAEARRFADRGDQVVLIGHAGHEETEGTLGEAPSIALVESVADVAELEPADPEKVGYLMQTTLSAAEADDIVAAIKERFPAAHGPGSDDICYATTNRQQAVRAVAARSDLVLVVGSANSANSKRLVEVAEQAGTAALLIDDPSGIDLRLLAGARVIGLTAGASAPPALVGEVITALGGLGPVEVTEHVVAVENVHFTLPKGVRP